MLLNGILLTVEQALRYCSAVDLILFVKSCSKESPARDDSLTSMPLTYPVLPCLLTYQCCSTEIEIASR